MTSLGMNAAAIQAMRKITPQCINMAPSLFLSGVIELVIISVNVILLLGTILYNYMHKAADDSAKDKKAKILGRLMLANTLLTVLTAFVAVWHIFVSGKLRKCITEAV